MTTYEDNLKALDGSIEKWRKIVDGTGEDLANANCPLCQLHNPVGKPYNGDPCVECPVYQDTKFYGCGNTPYDRWHRHQMSFHLMKGNKTRKVHVHDDGSKCSGCMATALAELDYLIGLRRKMEARHAQTT